jgi:hypothetical protein
MTRLAAITAVLITLTGCVSRTGEPVAEPPARSVTTTSTTTSTPPPPPTTAADGGNLAACADGTCEVRVGGQATIPVNPALGVNTVMVMSVTGDEVSATVTFSSGSLVVDCTGDPRCGTSVVGSTPPAAFLTGHRGAVITVNQLVIEVAAVADGAAILRLRTI